MSKVISFTSFLIVCVWRVGIPNDIPRICASLLSLQLGCTCDQFVISSFCHLSNFLSDSRSLICISNNWNCNALYSWIHNAPKQNANLKQQLPLCRDPKIRRCLPSPNDVSIRQLSFHWRPHKFIVSLHLCALLPEGIVNLSLCLACIKYLGKIIIKFT